jgi:thiol:disulfide interchange protein DsbA
MLLRPLMLCLLLAASACSKTDPSAAPAETVPAVAPAAPAQSAPTPAPATPPAGPAPVAGALQPEDYDVIDGGKPYGAAPGQIEVVEFFNYICPACNAFEPLMQAWKATLPADVRIVYVPADFRPDFEVYARAYYAADLLGIATKTHAAVYEAVHSTHTLPGEGRLPDVEVIAAFYAKHGVTAQGFLDAMSSFAVNTRMSQGRQYEAQSKLASTPSLLVNGRYMAKGKSFEDKLCITSLLIARERAAKP